MNFRPCSCGTLFSHFTGKWLIFTSVEVMRFLPQHRLRFSKQVQLQHQLMNMFLGRIPGTIEKYQRFVFLSNDYSEEWFLIIRVISQCFTLYRNCRLYLALLPLRTGKGASPEYLLFGNSRRRSDFRCLLCWRIMWLLRLPLWDRWFSLLAGLLTGLSVCTADRPRWIRDYSLQHCSPDYQ